MVQPNAFASWKADGKTLSLVLDVRAGGLPVELKGRRLKAVTIASRMQIHRKRLLAAKVNCATIE